MKTFQTFKHSTIGAYNGYGYLQKDYCKRLGKKRDETFSVMVYGKIYVFSGDEVSVIILDKIGREALWLLPGVAFDRGCRRLGQGGGYYDRTLERLRAFQRAGDTIAGVAFSCQIADRIPTEEWDASLDKVISPGEIYINQHI